MTEFYWLEIRFVVEKDEEEIEIASVTKRIPPRKGEYIWMPYKWEKEEDFGTRAFIVEDIAHHINPKHSQVSYDSIVVYCTPIIL